MTLPADFTFALQTFPAEEMSALRPYYDRLPLDPYIRGEFRNRRFSRFLGPANKLRRLDHAHFLQSKEINLVAGGMKRHFAGLEDGFIGTSVFQSMVTTFHNFIGIDPEVSEIGVHQIRIVCSSTIAGTPAPEGIHQDGFDYIAIFCVEQFRINGATTSVYPAKDQPPIFRRALEPGEVVFTNDRRVFHFAEEVRPNSDQPGHWDLLVITA